MGFVLSVTDITVAIGPGFCTAAFLSAVLVRAGVSWCMLMHSVFFLAPVVLATAGEPRVHVDALGALYTALCSCEIVELMSIANKLSKP